MRIHHRLRPLSMMNGGETHTCSNPDCNTTFHGAPWLGVRNGKPYCTRHCRDEMSQDPKPEDLARSVN